MSLLIWIGETKTLRQFLTANSLLSFAESAVEYKWVKPQLNEQNHIVIKEGRHPLQELCVDQFVPNDTQINIGGLELIEPADSLANGEREGTKGHTQLLFGPNYSGKSVYMKQVGLLCYMALLGSFVPALSASIGRIDRLFSRIQTQETSARPESKISKFWVSF